MIDPSEVNYEDLQPFRFKKVDDNYLLTNEVGEWIFLNEKNFNRFINGELSEKDSAYKKLKKNNFIQTEVDLEEQTKKFKKRNDFLLQSGPGLHIVVTTLRCDHACIYCQASSCDKNKREMDMSQETAKEVVDLIFESPNENLAIEFQGGEPLFNWTAVKTIVEYSLEKNKKEKRNLELRLVSNFTLMDENKKDWLLKNGVTFATSLDGPEELHNNNRKWSGGNSYKQAIKWLKKILDEYDDYYINQPGAITTVTKESLNYEKEIVDEYLSLGLDNIFLRPVNPLGVAKNAWEEIGYTAEEFLEFYKSSLDYIFQLNIENNDLRLREMTATYMASKILTNDDPNYLELRSPCGAGIGQLLYNYNGDIYTCDEGRMVGEDTFQIGKVKESNYEDLVSSPTVKSLCLASCLNNLPCDHCAYKPYCGTCPIVNYSESGNIFSQLPNSTRCKINKGILDYLFERIQEDDRIKEMLREWALNHSQYLGIKEE